MKSWTQYSNLTTSSFHYAILLLNQNNRKFAFITCEYANIKKILFNSWQRLECRIIARPMNDYMLGLMYPCTTNIIQRITPWIQSFSSPVFWKTQESIKSWYVLSFLKVISFRKKKRLFIHKTLEGKSIFFPFVLNNRNIHSSQFSDFQNLKQYSLKIEPFK